MVFTGEAAWRWRMMLPANDLERLAPALIETARTLDVGDAARRSRALTVTDCTPDRFASDICRAAELAVRLRRAPKNDSAMPTVR